MLSRSVWKGTLERMKLDAENQPDELGHARRLISLCDVMLELVELEDESVIAIYDRTLSEMLERQNR